MNKLNHFPLVVMARHSLLTSCSCCQWELKRSLNSFWGSNTIV